MNSSKEIILKNVPELLKRASTEQLAPVPDEVFDFAISLSEIADKDLTPCQLHNLVLNTLDTSYTNGNIKIMYKIAFFPLLVEKIANKDFFDSFRKIFEDDFGTLTPESI
ncbi:MAG: hypothetical protein V8R81_05275 [Clostridia bacterium]